MMYTAATQRRAYRLERLRRQRKAAMLRKKAFTMVLACIILVLSLCILSGFSSVPRQSDAGHLYYKTVTVSSNDTLWSIACAHAAKPYTSIPSYIHAIKQLNNMHSDKIYYGQKLLIPYYSRDLK